MKLDYNTLLIVIACINLVYFFLFYSLSRSKYKTISYRYWIIGFMVLFINHALLAFRSFFNEGVVLFITNTFILAGFVLILGGLHKFSRVKQPRMLYIILFSAICLGNYYFIFIQPSFVNRRIFTSVMMIFPAIMTLHLSVKQYKQNRNRGWFMVITVSVLAIIAYLTRIAETISTDNYSFFSSTCASALMANFFVFINLLFGISIFVLLNRRRIDIYENQLNIHETLLSSIGHDIKEPLAHIYQLSNLYNSSENKLNFPMEDVFGKIEILSFNANHLAHNLLNWTRLNKDDLHIKIEPADVNRILEEEIHLYQPIANIKKVHMKSEKNNAIRSIRTDVNMLRLILRNLINNAVKYSEEKTTIRCTIIESDPVVKIMIKDEGKGIPIEKLQLLNNPGELLKKRNENIGIQLCHWYIKKLNGKLFFESGSGPGSIATIELPIN